MIKEKDKVNDEKIKTFAKTIHSLCLIIKGLDADKSQLSKETHDLLDEFEKLYSEMYGENTE